jgi:hypothetical protein
VWSVLAKRLEKVTTLRALLMRVDVGDGFEERDDAESLPLGSHFTKPAVVRHG